jgi:hypothetical protein
MDLSSITRFRLRRVNPYRGLVVDESTWGEAHDYHRDHMRLHTLAFHDVGVVVGLTVTPTASQTGSVDVGAGVAVDGDGNMIVVGQERKLPFDGVAAGPVYITVSYEENRVNSEAHAPRGAPANRIVESYHLEATNKAPEGATLELARLYWSSEQASVKLALDAANPREDELDLRFRRFANAVRQVPVTIGVVGEESMQGRLRGLTNLMRELNNVAGYQARYRGGVNLEEGTGGADLLYVCAPVQSERAISTLQSHLGRGGAVFADSCATQANGETRKAVQDLAGRLGLKLTALEGSNPLLDTRYPFSEPPAGASEGEVVGSGRFVASLRDYGCAWSGSCGKDVLPRETVRSALEWGVNVALASVQG